MGTYAGQPPSVPKDLGDPVVQGLLKLVSVTLGEDRRVALEGAWDSAGSSGQARRGLVTGELGIDRDQVGEGESPRSERRRRQRAELAAFLTDAWPFPYVAGLVAPAAASDGSSGAVEAAGLSLDVRYRFGSDLFLGERPVYVGRDFDVRLDGRLDAAAVSSEVGSTPLYQRVVVLVGPPKAGKTRAAFEALHRLERHRSAALGRSCAYRLLALRGADGSGSVRGSDTALLNRFAAVYQRAAGCFDSDHRVVFVDDLQHHITTGAAIQAAFDLLCQARPRGTIIVATCWPEAIDSPVSNISHGDRDFLNRVRVDVPVELTDYELERLCGEPAYQWLLDGDAVELKDERRVVEIAGRAACYCGSGGLVDPAAVPHDGTTDACAQGDPVEVDT